jgi:hypothetical protein
MYGSLPRPGFTGHLLRAHDPARHSLSGPARNHLPGHVPSSGSRTVLTLRLGIPDHGSPFDHFVANPLLSGGAQCPGPDSDGLDTTVTSPSRSGRAQHPARTRCGLGLILARLSPLTAQRHGVQRARMLGRSRARQLPRLTTPPSWLLKPLELHEGTTTRRSPPQVVYPKPPRCSPDRDANGVRSP